MLKQAPAGPYETGATPQIAHTPLALAHEERGLCLAQQACLPGPVEVEAGVAGTGAATTLAMQQARDLLHML